MVRPTFAEIDLSAIRHNVAELAALIAPAQLCAVVKADAYGHGDAPVAEAALAAGASRLAVALVEEGARLREAGIDAPILLLSEPGVEAVHDVVEWELTPTVYTAPFIAALDSNGVRRRVQVHLKVDTGMHRVGAAPEAAVDLVGQVRRAPNLELEGVWTHFAVADEDPSYTREQIERFSSVAEGIEAPIAHMANTAGAIIFPEARADMCRVGLGIYGLHPCDDTRDRIDLRPAMRVVSRVTHVRRLGMGSRPSYGRISELAGDSTVATVPVGYADGYSRGLSRAGAVLIGGRRHRLAGMVTMDQIVVDVGDEEVGLGDEVVLVGRQGEEEITADEIATLLGTITYEVVCSIGPRVPRRHSS
jgi:alanine racemase